MSESIKKQLVTGGGVKVNKQPRQMANRPTAPAEKPKASFSGKPGSFNPFGKSEDGVGYICCPDCGCGISKGYAVKALAMLAKSEGQDLSADLEALAGLEAPDGSKAMDVGNKVNSNRGPAPGAFVKQPRAGGKKGVERANRPTNPVNEKGMNKSLSLPILNGDAQLVDYGFGEDSFVAKGIEEGTHHLPVARNLRAERELATGKVTE